jgi:hypothetical protein
VDPACLTLRGRCHPTLQIETELEPEEFVAIGPPPVVGVAEEEAPRDAMPEERLFQKRTIGYAYQMPAMVAGMGGGFEKN